MGGVFYQVICTLISCYLCMSIGLMFAWPSCTFRIFESTNTTLHRPMHETELALLGSLSSVGAMIATPVAGYLLDVVGRKACIIAAALAQVIAWTLIACCKQVEVVLASLFISGLGAMGSLAVPVFISEISEQSVRGALTACSMIFYALGTLLSYIIGGCLSYNAMVYVCLTLAVLGVILTAYLTESPVYLMKKGLEEEAAKSFAFYRHAGVDSKEVSEEMDSLKRAFNPDLDSDENSPEEEKLRPDLNVDASQREKLSVWRFIKKSKSTQRALVISLVLMTACLFQGLIAVQVFAEPIFEAAVPGVSPTLCSVVLAVMTVVFGILAAYLTDVIGRRPLLIYSSLAAAASCLVLGIQLHFHWASGWLSATSMYLFTIAYSLGGGTVPYVLACEVFLPEVKSFIAMIIVEWAYLCNFILLFIFNPLVAIIGLGPVFYIFSSVCFFTAIFSVFFLPETKGLAIDVIQTFFVEKKIKKMNSCKDVTLQLNSDVRLTCYLRVNSFDTKIT